MHGVNRALPGLVATAVAACAWLACSGAATAAVPPSPVGGLTRAPDGTMWFAATRMRIGRILPTGRIGVLPAALRGRASGIATGPDGNVWFTEPEAKVIGRMTPLGVLTEFPVPVPPYAIAAGADGRLWFTTLGPDVGSIDTGGSVTLHPTGLVAGTATHAITAGPDGNLWFTSGDGLGGTDRLNRIAPSGVPTLGIVVSGDRALGGLASGPDGNVWLARPDDATILRVTPTGAITAFPAPGATTIAPGPDGNLWFAAGDAIGRITPGGVVTRFRKGLSGPVLEIADGPGGLWFTDGDGRLGRITTAGRVSEFPATARVRSVRQPARAVIVVRLHCSAGNITPCRGTLILGQSGRGGRTAFAVAPGRTRDVRVVFSSAMRRLLVGRRAVEVTLLLRPIAHSLVGGTTRRITLHG